MHVSWKQHAITECTRMKNSAKQIKCLGFLGKKNVWKIPTCFQKQGKQIVNLYTFLFIRQTCTSVWFDNAQSANQVKKLIQVFPVTALLAFSNSPSHRSSRNSTGHLLGGMVLLLKCLLFFSSVDKSLTALRNGSPSVYITLVIYYYICCTKLTPHSSCCLFVYFGNWAWKITRLVWNSFRIPYSCHHYKTPPQSYLHSLPYNPRNKKIA